MSEPHIIAPKELENFLVIENCDDFPIDRYYETKDQKDLINAIIETENILPEMHKLRLPYLNATLLAGPPGNGKTTFARFVAFTLGIDLVFINFAPLVSGILGSTSKYIHEIFSFLKDKRCIFLLDEIDTIGVKRGTESDATGGELSRITVTVMQELDYYKTHDYKPIILVATNRKDILDPALLSRFAVTKELPSLTNSERIEYMYKFLNDVFNCKDGDEIPYEKSSIEQYVLDNSTVRQRNIEMDMIRCIAKWVQDGKRGKIVVKHVD